jgi:IS30 family transposase
VSKLAANTQLRGVVAAKLDDDWSPQQIAQWLRREHPNEALRRVSHESIYRDVYMPSRKVFDASMFHRLRSHRSIRRPRGKRSSHGRGQIRNPVSIRERPVEADDREVAGHWEGDLVCGVRPSAVVTLVDRATRYAMVVALPDGHKAEAVARALIEQMGRLPAHLRRSLTWDRGLEMAHHATITATLSMPVFFCDPHHPWQRGTNENTNRLLRQYLHKNADLGSFTQDQLDSVAAKLNHRPRRVLGWATPAEALGTVQSQPMAVAPA